ncbi:MAG: hypothetical protein H6672_05810 [Anaerolineaceae bacterium]|nr:hypothetical protein [Anaerolineaceae bacterium]
MSNVVFKAFASPTSAKLPNGKPIGDHTYVKTPTKTWPCLGGSSGGRALGSGSASLAQGTCTGDPIRTTFMGIPSAAGVVYGVNGVCHQIANRVLYYSGATVKGAKGYVETQLTYGTYGITVPWFLYFIPGLDAVATAVEISVLVDWNKRVNTCSSAARAFAASSLEGKIADLHESISANPPQTREDKIEHHLKEVELLLDDAGIEQGKVEQVKNLFRDKETQVTKPTTALSADQKVTYDAVQAAHQMSELSMGFFRDMAGILGDADFKKVFGRTPDEEFNIIDPSLLGPKGCAPFFMRPSS